MDSILDYLKLKPSAQSIDYVENKKQFHLFTLLTEQRHLKTWTLSSAIRGNTKEGLQMLLEVDKDISSMIEEYSKNLTVIEQTADAVCRAINEGRKIYFYGCGSTGRLSKLMESTLWRPFWRKIKTSPVWKKLENKLPDDIEDRLIGEMTGADRALISSLEGFEDLQLIGRLQLNDRGIERGDVVFCVTEGGETSSVIGTILAALAQYGEPDDKITLEASERLFFVYNNPDHLLIPFERSRMVLENPGITKLNLATGPQGITGSTRMQATTSETFILGVALENAIYNLLKDHLSGQEMAEIGFEPGISLSDRLLSFSDVKLAVGKCIDTLAEFTDSETETCKNRRFATYFAREALITVFIDGTERSPTFRLHPLDTINGKRRKSWIQVWTDAKDLKEGWYALLGRNFRGLDPHYYKLFFEKEIADPYLKETALKSLEKAGNDQESLYDLSFSDLNIKLFGPDNGDIGVIVCVDEERSKLNDPDSVFRRFGELFREKGAKIAIVAVNGKPEAGLSNTFEADVEVNIKLPSFPDPLGLRRQIALKMLLNAHSTGLMAKLGRVIGNTMTSVNPSNLKLIGRATYLVKSHVNDIISKWSRTQKYGSVDPVSFEDVNAVLFDSMDYVAGINSGQTAEVALSIIRILEALKTRSPVTWDEARFIHEEQGLEGYLKNSI